MFEFISNTCTRTFQSTSNFSAPAQIRKLFVSGNRQFPAKKNGLLRYRNRNIPTETTSQQQPTRSPRSRHRYRHRRRRVLTTTVSRRKSSRSEEDEAPEQNYHFNFEACWCRQRRRRQSLQVTRRRLNWLRKQVKLFFFLKLFLILCPEFLVYIVRALEERQLYHTLMKNVLSCHRTHNVSSKKAMLEASQLSVGSLKKGTQTSYVITE